MPSLLEAVGVARSQGATVIALTQPGTAAGGALPTSCSAIEVAPDAVMHVGTEAYLAHLTVIEILTVLVAQRLGDPAVQPPGRHSRRPWKRAASTCSTTRRLDWDEAANGTTGAAP